MEIEEGQAQVIQKFVKKLQLLKPPPLSPTSSLKPLLTRLFSLFPRFYLSLISSSFKELRILLILIYFAYLVMEPGVITKVILLCCQSCHMIKSSSSNNSLCLLFLRPIRFSLTINFKRNLRFLMCVNLKTSL